MASQEHLRQLVDAPSEALAVEIKTWIDPSSPEGKAKIARACLGLRNQDGGFLVIGFDDGSLVPSAVGRPVEVRNTFHPDVVQGIASKYSSEKFEVEVHFVERDGLEFPVVEIPPGVRSPAVSRSAINAADGRCLLAENKVLVRTLAANGIVSTSEAKAADWPRLMEICLNNREADIGRFLRRQLAGVSPAALRHLADSIGSMADIQQTAAVVETLVDARTAATREPGVIFTLNEGATRWAAKASEEAKQAARFGSWEVAVAMQPQLPERNASTKLLNDMLTSNPQLTGWPTWLDSRLATNSNHHPHIDEGTETWEAFVVDLRRGYGNHVDFWRLSPMGRFYLFRALQDDMQENPAPGTELDFALPLLRTAEALVVAQAFAKALDFDTETANMSVALRWRGLKGRVLSSWAQPLRPIHSSRQAHRDEVTTYGVIPLATPASAFGPFLNAITKDLLDAFDGFELSSDVVEDLLKRLLERKL